MFNVTFFPLTVFYIRGAFSIVKKCVHKESGKQFAAKIINKRRLTARGKGHCVRRELLL